MGANLKAICRQLGQTRLSSAETQRNNSTMDQPLMSARIERGTEEKAPSILVKRLMVAILGDSEEQITALGEKISRLNHGLRVFTKATDLLEALSNAERFDLLLLSPQNEIAYKSLSAVCGVIDVPVLFVVEQKNWKDLSAWGANFAQSDAIEFDVVRAVDEELKWRMEALLSKKSSLLSNLDPAKEMNWGDYRFSLDTNFVFFRGKEVRLQPREFRLALELFRNMGRVVPREHLTRAAWRNIPLSVGARGLDVCATGVRKKLELHGESGLLLRAVYRQGYQLVQVPLGAHERKSSGTGLKILTLQPEPSVHEILIV